jgi:hypothetical protein
MIIEETGEKDFAAMVETNRKAAYPKWYARAKGYDGGSRTSTWGKNKNWQLALEAVPMRDINKCFAKKRQQQQCRQSVLLLLLRRRPPQPRRPFVENT